GRGGNPDAPRRWLLVRLHGSARAQGRHRMIDLARLETALKRMPGFEALLACERLSAGASRETYRLRVMVNGSEKNIALRRADGDGSSPIGSGPGLDAEALLFSTARGEGDPGPEVLLVLEPDDQLGAGFAMEWIE